MTGRAIPEKESLTVEFKSDRSQLSDDDLIGAAVCLANTQGGDICFGVEVRPRVLSLFLVNDRAAEEHTRDRHFVFQMRMALTYAASFRSRPNRRGDIGIVHHDLAWNPSALEQRIDRLGSLTAARRKDLPAASLDVAYPLIHRTIDVRLHRTVKSREKVAGVRPRRHAEVRGVLVQRGAARAATRRSRGVPGDRPEFATWVGGHHSGRGAMTSDSEETRCLGEESSDGEPRTLEWDGITQRTSNGDWLLAERDRLADAARAARWPEVLDVLRERSMLVNSARLGGTSGFTPLHQAAYVGGPARVVEELLHLGAWRTLRNAKGERAVDVARRKGQLALFGLLEPVIASALDEEKLRGLETQFHTVIRERVAREIVEHQFRLPELEPMTEFGIGQRFWFPVPGMYGGFVYWLDGAGEAPTLTIESWCRVVDGSGQRHRVTGTWYELVAEGFV